MGLGQSQQVSLGRQNLPEPVAERRTQIAGLAGLLGDDQGRHAPQPYPIPWDGPTPDQGTSKGNAGAQAWCEMS